MRRIDMRFLLMLMNIFYMMSYYMNLIKLLNNIKILKKYIKNNINNNSLNEIKHFRKLIHPEK